jgi:hypothetical protein
MKLGDHPLLRAILTGAILWFSLVVPVPLYAQGGDTPLAPARGGVLRFEHLTPENGLPSLTVRSIVQD